MNTQNQIKRTLSQPTHIEYVSNLLANNEFRNRKALATRVCEAFAFYDPGGQAQRSGCLKALRELEAAGHFSLPASARRCGARSPRRLAQPVALPVEVPAQAGEVRGLELIMVDSTDPEVVDFIEAFSRVRLGREIIRTADTPAFAGNRVGFKVLNEAAQLAEQLGPLLTDRIIGPYTGRAMTPPRSSSRAIPGAPSGSTPPTTSSTCATPAFP